MPNLNLKNDAPEEISELSEVQEAETADSDSRGSMKKMLPLVAGGVLALLLAFYILNKIGIVHLWGNKKATSVMTVTIPADSSMRVLTDSEMAEQFKKDSIEAAAASKPRSKNKTALQEASNKKKAEAKPAIAAIQKTVPVKPSVAVTEKQPAAAVKTAPAEKPSAVAASKQQKNMTTVEVPGVPQRRAAFVDAPEKVQKREALAAAPAPEKTKVVKTDAAAPEKTKAVKTAAPAPEKTKTMKSDLVQHTRRAQQPGVAAKKDAAPAQAPAETAKPQGGGQFTVQISSWMSMAKARAFAARFTGAGIPAFVSTEGHVHRVCTGHFATQEEAAARGEQLVPMLESKYDIIVLK